jgi:protein O-GlcNAc transferase
VIYLPNSCQCHDSRRHLPHSAASRAAAGLPEAGFVYCCFNNHYKIGPEVFAVWMRLLRAIPASVLWILCEDAYATHNLRREALARGVAPERLVFAPRMEVNKHLARLQVADLFLDTLPYNAHATAADALWAGLPLLTCLGNSYASRVAASLLHALGLPELVTNSLAEYEALAVALARDPERLAAIRTTLEHNRHTEPLFDTPRFTRNLETAYTAIWQRQQAGLPPAMIRIDEVIRSFS